LRQQLLCRLDISWFVGRAYYLLWLNTSTYTNAKIISLSP